MAARRQQKRSARSSSAVQATYPELQALLSQHAKPLQEKIGLPGARLMLPVDGRGARVLVGVDRSKRAQVPAKVTMALRGRRLVVPLEVDEKYLPANIF